MSTPTRTRAPADRRDQLLVAAERLFAEKGVDATTVADITGLAGVAKGTFYLYFDSKDQLIAGLRERVVNGMLELAAESFARIGTTDYWQLADEIVATIVDYEMEHREAVRAVLESGMSRETMDFMHQCNQRMIDMLEAGIRAGMDAGVFAVSDPHVTAELLNFACEGTVHARLLQPGDIDRDRLVAGTQEFVRKVLAP